MSCYRKDNNILKGGERICIQQIDKANYHVPNSIHNAKVKDKGLNNINNSINIMHEGKNNGEKYYYKNTFYLGHLWDIISIT